LKLPFNAGFYGMKPETFEALGESNRTSMTTMRSSFQLSVTVVFGKYATVCLPERNLCNASSR
jgi:hypothetical protein